MKEFVDFLEPVNKFADESPGFIWRMKGEDGQASSFLSSPFEDPMIVTNLTVWSDVTSLRAFVYNSVHRYFLQSRKNWFEKVTSPQVVLWWTRAGQLPDLAMAKEKLNLLTEAGPGPTAFTFQTQFDPFGTKVVS
jgi:hypothetical protein